VAPDAERGRTVFGRPAAHPNPSAGTPASGLQPEEPIMSDTTKTPSEIDIRSLAPAQRHEKIFQLVAGLAPGGSFVFVNDHDPKPLRYQIDAEHPNQYSWTYLESGPTAWRVEIGKL
jgi:uncharacterized protein (DUF2249 family)